MYASCKQQKTEQWKQATNEQGNDWGSSSPMGIEKSYYLAEVTFARWTSDNLIMLLKILQRHDFYESSHYRCTGHLR